MKICRYFCFAIKLVFPHRIRIQWLRSHDIHFVNGGRRKMQETNKSETERPNERWNEKYFENEYVWLLWMDSRLSIFLPHIPMNE